jgi:hypothetical protein
MPKCCVVQQVLTASGYKKVYEANNGSSTLFEPWAHVDDLDTDANSKLLAVENLAPDCCMAECGFEAKSPRACSVCNSGAAENEQ